MSWQEWINKVDSKVYATIGCSVFDLPDCCLRDWFEDGISPTEAAMRAIEDI